MQELNHIGNLMLLPAIIITLLYVQIQKTHILEFMIALIIRLHIKMMADHFVLDILLQLAGHQVHLAHIILVQQTFPATHLKIVEQCTIQCRKDLG